MHEETAYGKAYNKAYGKAYNKAYGKAYNKAYGKAYNKAYNKAYGKVDPLVLLKVRYEEPSMQSSKRQKNFWILAYLLKISQRQQGFLKERSQTLELSNH